MKSIIIYTTKYGSTTEAARRLNDRMGGECTLVNLIEEKSPAIDGYDAVILGGSVYAGMVQKQLKGYIKSSLPQLLSKKVGLFLCAANQDKEQIKKEMELAFPAELLSHSLVHDVLGYAYAFEKMKFLDKFILKKVKGDDKSAAEYYDDRIEKFAEAVRGISHK